MSRRKKSIRSSSPNCTSRTLSAEPSQPRDSGRAKQRFTRLCRRKSADCCLSQEGRKGTRRKQKNDDSSHEEEEAKKEECRCEGSLFNVYRLRGDDKEEIKKCHCEGGILSLPIQYVKMAKKRRRTKRSNGTISSKFPPNRRGLVKIEGGYTGESP